ncbi:uncharacterized protein FFB20_01887 [Fusarium fujikuroi]|jgi:hypothetical protein
MEA